MYKSKLLFMCGKSGNEWQGVVPTRNPICPFHPFKAMPET